MTTLCEMHDSEEVGTILQLVRDHDGDSLASRFRSLLSNFDPTDDADDTMQLTEEARSAWWGSNETMEDVPAEEDVC